MSDAWVALGRTRQELAHQVYARDQYCYFCGRWVDQTLPPTHPYSRTAHHIVEIQDGGSLKDIDMMALAHWSCNSTAGAKRARQRQRQAKQARQAIHIDPAAL